MFLVVFAYKFRNLFPIEQEEGGHQFKEFKEFKEFRENSLNSLSSLNSLIGAQRQAPFTEPTPNRGQRVLAHFAEVRRRKTKSKGVWGIGNTKGGVYTTILKATKTSRMEGLCDYMKKSFISSYTP